jgi:hypothetical protein
MYTLALDWQEQARILITQRLCTISVINSFREQRDILIESLITRCWQCVVGLHRFISTDFGKKANFLSTVVIGADSRLRRQIPVHARLASSGAFQRIYDFPQRDSLHDFGVIFIEISQPTGKSFEDTAIVAIAVDREAARLEQRAIMTDKVRELMRQHSART